MKKFFIIVGMALMVASCTTITKTSKTAESPVSLLSATVADLEPVTPKRESFDYNVPVEVRRGGKTNAKRAAEKALLEKFDADVLLEPQYVITSESSLFGKKIVKVTVSGRPAKYKNFHSLNDSVWCNPTFRDNHKNDAKTAQGLLNKLF